MTTMPEAKKLSDDSNETIDSHELSKSFSPNRSKINIQNNYFSHPETNESKGLVAQTYDNKLFSFNAGLLDSQRSN